MTAPMAPKTLGYWKAAQPASGNVKKAGSGPAKPGASSGGRRRIVRTAAGARRYKVPIGSEIRPARNESSKRFQNHQPSRQRYAALVGRDRGAQAQALKGLNRTQLTRLTALAWSFKSKDARVTQLRTALTKELYNRGINVRTYLAEVGVRGKSLGRGSAFRHSKDRKGRPMPGTVEDKAAKAHKPKPGGRGRRSSGAAAPVRRPRPPLRKKKPAVQPAGRIGSALKLSNVGQLRQAQTAFTKVAPKHRERVARFLVTQAVELSAVHMLSRQVVEASNVAPDSELGQRVIELAGRWKHGWIPLDATAVASKMKGGKGKPWWKDETPGKSSGRNKPQGLYGKLMAESAHPSTKRQKKITEKYRARNKQQHLDEVAQFDREEAARKKARAARRAKTRARYAQGGKSTPSIKSMMRQDWESDDEPDDEAKAMYAKLVGPQGKRGPASMRKSIEAGRKARGSKNRTTVVKSGGKPASPGGTKVNTPEQSGPGSVSARPSAAKQKLINDLQIEKRTLEGLATRRKMTKREVTRYAKIKAQLAELNK